ncbi:helix-turn-helix transcriptional regulator [Clostridioides difficile]|uniref:helix-turn-helix transcriptional regulator n=1 Tax=Clostridioides difficile TaxID=1496 RepID=UPI002E8DEFB1|nr:helix-turn-helix transcriptional regulator [Clostridioides difficile]
MKGKTHMELDFRAIGQRIKIARIKKRLTQDTVSELINITPSHMSNIETGKSTVSLPTLIAIANTLGVSIDELLCDTILNSKIVFEKELSDILKDCNEYEIRVLVDIVKASKESIRNVKMFQSKLENRY